MNMYICSYCKKNIGHKSDIYKAFDLNFCSHLCRHYHYTFNNVTYNIKKTNYSYNNNYYKNKLKSYKSINKLNELNNLNTNNSNKEHKIIINKYVYDNSKNYVKAIDLKKINSKCSYYFYFSLNNLCYLINYFIS